MSRRDSSKSEFSASAKIEFALPASAYREQSQFDREKHSIFWKEWFCVGRDERLDRPGSYAEVSVAGERILLVRARDNVVRAFYNVCRHRGSRLCGAPLDNESGADSVERIGKFRGSIVCPYHAWTYELDGRLRKAPFFEHAGESTLAEYGLRQIALANWRGFLWVNLAEEVLTPQENSDIFLAQLPKTVSNMANYPLEDLRCGGRLVYEVDANWKVLAENYNECYHCGPVHPELCKLVPAFKESGGANLDWDHGIPHRDGAWTFSNTGSSNRAPFPGLTDVEKNHHKGEIIFPNLWLSLAAEHVAAFTLWPRSPSRTSVTCEFLFHKDEVAGDVFDPDDVIDFWDTVNRQDWRICESVQDGMTSGGFSAGIMAPMENSSLDIRRYVDDRVRSDIVD